MDNEGVIEKYIGDQREDIREILENILRTIRENAPETTERICMRMPTFDLDGKWLVHFGAFKNHAFKFALRQTV